MRNPFKRRPKARPFIVAQHINDDETLFEFIGEVINDGFLIPTMGHTTAVLSEVHDERMRQDAKWSVQDHPDFRPGLPRAARAAYYGVPFEEAAKYACEAAFQRGGGSFADILIEEVSEAINATDEKALREELVQVAATAVKWIEAIDRRKAKEYVA